MDSLIQIPAQIEIGVFRALKNKSNKIEIIFCNEKDFIKLEMSRGHAEIVMNELKKEFERKIE